MRTSAPPTTTRFPVDRLVLEYGDDGSAVLIVHLGAATSRVTHDDAATEPVYARSPRVSRGRPSRPSRSSAPLALGTDVAMGRRPSRRLLAAGIVAVVVAVAGIATISAGSGSAPAVAPTASVPTPSAIVDDAVSPPAKPMACRGDAPFSPEGCAPVPSTSSPGVSVVEAVGCLSLIRTAARALGLDPDTYPQVLATRSDTTQTIDGAIHQQLTQARLFLGGQAQDAGSTSDRDLSIALDALDEAIAAADTARCSG